MKTKRVIALVSAASVALIIALVGFLWYEAPYGKSNESQTAQAVSGFKNFKNIFTRARFDASNFVAPVEDAFSTQQNEQNASQF